MSMDMFWSVYGRFATVALIFLGIIAILALIKSVVGPTAYDRVVSVNMLGTITMAMIAILFVKLREGYLADICLIYAMISFLAVIVFCKVYYGAYKAKKKAKKEAKKNGNA